MSPPRSSRWALALLLACGSMVSAFMCPPTVWAPAPKDLTFGEPTLKADVASLSLVEGGKQKLIIDAGKAYAGREYLVVGSASGTFPGTQWDSLIVPLNYDIYSEALFALYRKPPCVSFSGHLDSQGRAYPEIALAGNSIKLVTGKTYYHAAIIYDAKKTRIDNATNAVELLVLP